MCRSEFDDLPGDGRSIAERCRDHERLAQDGALASGDHDYWIGRARLLLGAVPESVRVLESRLGRTEREVVALRRLVRLMDEYLPQRTRIDGWHIVRECGLTKVARRAFDAEG